MKKISMLILIYFVFGVFLLSTLLYVIDKHYPLDDSYTDINALRSIEKEYRSGKLILTEQRDNYYVDFIINESENSLIINSIKSSENRYHSLTVCTVNDVAEYIINNDLSWNTQKLNVSERTGSEDIYARWRIVQTESNKKDISSVSFYFNGECYILECEMIESL